MEAEAKCCYREGKSVLTAAKKTQWSAYCEMKITLSDMLKFHNTKYRNHIAFFSYVQCIMRKREKVWSAITRKAGPAFSVSFDLL